MWFVSGFTFSHTSILFKSYVMVEKFHLVFWGNIGFEVSKGYICCFWNYVCPSSVCLSIVRVNKTYWSQSPKKCWFASRVIGKKQKKCSMSIINLFLKISYTDIFQILTEILRLMTQTVCYITRGTYDSILID